MRIRALLIVAASTVVIAGCGSSEPAIPVSEAGTATTVAAADGGPDLSKETFDDLTGEKQVAVQARDNTFVKPYIEVSVGTTVEFTNKGRNQHDVLPVNPDAFSGIPVEDFQPKDSGSITFSVPGDYPYYCSLHGTPTKGMIGAIRVLS